MNTFLIVASALLAVAFGQARDPTKVCLPDVLESNIYEFENDLVGVLSYDFPNKQLAVRYNNKLRVVISLSDLSAVSVNETDGKCVKLLPNANYKTVAIQCLPANAVPLTNDTIYVGSSTRGTEIEAWELDVPGAGVVRYAVTKGTPALPVVREFKGTGKTQSNTAFFTNSRTTISNKSVFTVPSVCTPATPVG